MADPSCAWRNTDTLVVIRKAAKSPDGNSVIMLATTQVSFRTWVWSGGFLCALLGGCHPYIDSNHPQAHVAFAANLLDSLRRVGIVHTVLFTPDESLLLECVERDWSCVFHPTPSDEVAVLSSTDSAATAAERNATAARSRSMTQHSKVYNRFTWARIGYAFDFPLSYQEQIIS